MANFLLAGFWQASFPTASPFDIQAVGWATSELTECIQLAEYIRQLLMRKKKSFAAFCLFTRLSLTVRKHPAANTRLSPLK